MTAHENQGGTHTLHLLGDSTCAEKKPVSRPQTGWGEEFTPFLAPDWNLANHAVNGLSTKLMLSSGLFGKVLDTLKDGDWVTVQFGHNETKPDIERHTEPWTTYTENLEYIAAQVREKGSSLIFLSSITRRRFVDGVIRNTHEEYPDAMEQSALKLNIPYIDMNKITMGFLTAMGEEASKELFMHLEPGESPNYPEGVADDTHLRPQGARLIARIIYEQMASSFPGLPFLGSSATG